MCAYRTASPISVYLAGDSTCCHYGPDRAPRAGWGQALARYLAPNVRVNNEAASGRSSGSFIAEGRLAAIVDRIGAGDCLFIQFGHNDQKEDERYADPFTTFQDNLSRFVRGAGSKGAIPVLITPVQRRSFDEQGRFRETHGDYPAAVRQLARRLETPLIDLTASSGKLLDILGAERAKKLFMWLKPGESGNYPDGVRDDTHFCERGAREVARLVAEGVKESRLSLAAFVDPDADGHKAFPESRL